MSLGQFVVDLVRSQPELILASQASSFLFALAKLNLAISLAKA